MSGNRLTRRDFLKLTAATGLGLSAASVLSACNTAATQAPAQNVTLTMWGNHPEWKDLLIGNVATFEKSTGYTITLDPKPGADYVQLLNAAFQAGEGPDLPGVVPGPLLDDFLDNGYIMDLNGKVSTDSLIDIAKTRVTRSNGRVAGVPFGKFTVGMFYHKQMFQDLNIAVPKTWDDMKQACQTLKDAGKTAMLMPAKDGTIPSFFYLMASGSVYGPSGFQDLLSGKRKLTDPDIVAAAQLMYDLVPYYPDGFASIAYADGKASFAREEIAISVGGSADYAGYLQVNPNVNVDFFAFPPPSASSGFPVTVSGLDLVYGVNAKSQFADQALEFVKWLTTKDASQLFANTIELPVVKDVIPDKPIWAKQVSEAKNDMPFMREIVATAPVWNVLTQQIQSMLLGQITPEQMSQNAQDALVVS